MVAFPCYHCHCYHWTRTPISTGLLMCILQLTDNQGSQIGLIYLDICFMNWFRRHLQKRYSHLRGKKESERQRDRERERRLIILHWGRQKVCYFKVCALTSHKEEAHLQRSNAPLQHCMASTCYMLDTSCCPVQQKMNNQKQ